MLVESDDSLVTRAQAGDMDAFRVLVERHTRSVFRLAFRLTGNEQDADEVVQDSFVKASADRLVLSGQIQARMRDALNGLSDRERTAFLLRHIEGLSIEEIASQLNLKTNATKHSIFRAVRKMRTALGPFVGV
jgi:DNA-directed RNA polymerase specialized sigma24 family protein